MSAFMAAAARGKNDWWRYLLTTPLGIILWIVILGVIYVPLVVTGHAPASFAEDLTKPTHPIVFFLATGLIFGVLLLGFVLAIWLVHRKRPGDVVGLWSWPRFAQGAGIWFAVLLVGSAADFALAPHSFRISLSAQSAPFALCAMLGLGVQTFAEEFIFRGYATQGLLLATRRPWVAAAISGAIFGALHYANGGPQAVNALFFGFATAVMAMRTGGLAFTFGLHLVNNIFGAVFVVSNDDVFRGSPGLFTQTAPQLMGLDVALGAVALAGVLWFTRGWRTAEPAD